MLFYESLSHEASYNLSLEEYLFNNLSDKDSLFMLWQNDRSVIIGKNQNTDEEVNIPYTLEKKINIVRRMTGGGAVFHDLGNINFTFIIGSSKAPAFDFKIFLKPLIRVLEEMGLKATFTGRNDITVNGKKICGNSQYLSGNKLMHHGCILLQTDLKAAELALKVDSEKLSSKGINSVKSRITNINDEILNQVSVREFMDRLKKEVEKELGAKLTPLKLNKKELQEIEKLKEEKYKSTDWNYGKSPKYNEKLKKHYQAGTVSAFLLVNNNILESIKFYGDFFDKQNISKLEELLIGSKRSELAERINSIDIENYINSISREDLADLFR